MSRVAYVRAGKSIFKDMRNNRGIKEAVKHNLGKGTFRIRSGFELLHQAQSKLSEHIQVLLDGTIYDTAEVFRKMDIKNPVHGFHGPFHPGMMKQLQCGKIAAGDIVMPFFGFSPFSLEFCLDCADTA